MSDYEPSRHRETMRVADGRVEGFASQEAVNRACTTWLRKRGLIADPSDAHAGLGVPGARYGRRGGPRGKKKA